jgi:hypothetical protein
MLRAAIGVVVWLAAAPIFAQTLITPDEFLDAADGRTLTFHIFPNGQLVGAEEFLTRSLSVWRDHAGTCVYGDISVDSANLCFLYDGRDGQDCWLPFRQGDRLFVRIAELGKSEIQEVTHISDDTLSCPVKPGV